MWWKKLEENAEILRTLEDYVNIDPTARVNDKAVIKGAVSIGAGTIIGHGAIIEGPVVIGSGCLVGDYSKIRGPAYIKDGTRIGYSCELRNAVLGEKVSVGPMCFVSDSVVDEEAYLGAMVRTSNQMLDRSTAKSFHDGKVVDTGLEKLGAFIGARTALGIQVIILPGRIVPADSLFGPRITIEKNLPPGRYVLKQDIGYKPLE